MEKTYTFSYDRLWHRLIDLKMTDENGAFDDQRDCQYGKRKIGEP